MRKIFFDDFDFDFDWWKLSTIEQSKSISRNFLACWIEGKHRTRSVVRFRVWIRVPLRQSRATKFQSFSFVPEFNQWGRVKEGRGADESNAEFSVKLFQNQIVDSYGNTQDVKISRKLNSKSFYLLFTEGVTIDEWTRGVWSLIQTEIRSNRFSRGNSIFRIFFRNFHDCMYYR